MAYHDDISCVLKMRMEQFCKKFRHILGAAPGKTI